MKIGKACGLLQLPPSLVKKLYIGMLTHRRPTVLAISDNFRLCWRISMEWIEILKILRDDKLQPLPCWVKNWQTLIH